MILKNNLQGSSKRFAIYHFFMQKLIKNALQQEVGLN